MLDRRLTSSSYGKRFLQSIPNPLYEGPLEELLVQLEEPPMNKMEEKYA